MRIVLEVPDDAFETVQGAMEVYRRQEVRLQRPIRTARGNGKLVVRAYVNIYDRKKPWKLNPKMSMQHKREVQRLRRVAAEGAVN